MATDDQSSPPPVRASEQDWKRIADSWAWSPSLCLLELRDRVAALEAAGGRVPAAPDGGGLTVEQLAECLPGNAWQGPNGYSRRVFAEHLLSHPITGPRLRTEPTPAAAPAGVTVDELADCLPASASTGPYGYNRQAFAGHLLDHPRIGPLLRGEGAAAPKRVVLPEEPPFWRMPYVEGPGAVDALARAVWAAARAEVERQQQGGQADG
jgi:hypothetical protein